MIYLIDDKTSRQESYGWDESRFSEFSDCVSAIRNYEQLKPMMSDIAAKGNVILYHESFKNIVPQEELAKIEGFERLLNENSTICVAHFSGSTSSRWIDDKGLQCVLSPDVLYDNLETFAKHYRQGACSLRYLLFGENYSQEEYLVNRFEEIVKTDVKREEPEIDISKSLFFALTFPTAIEPPFQKCEKDDTWDADFDKGVTDVDLDKRVKEWFSEKKYDAIYIPLCFGPMWSDFLGLRLAMHIRSTETLNHFTPIFIYGVMDEWQEIYKQECSDILRTKGVKLISAERAAIADSIHNLEETEEQQFHKDLANVHINIPSSLGDNHSVANKWAIHRWLEMIDWEGDVPVVDDGHFKETLYFKYLEVKFGKHDRFGKKHKYPWRQAELAGKTIVYIDDEFHKGWEAILRKFFEKNNARFVCYHDFSKSYSQEELTGRIQSFLDANPADCFLIDLRLHESDNGSKKKAEELTGQKLIKYLLEKNKANKVIVFTASNKVWNLNYAMENGAFGYVVKESPDMNYSRGDSKNIFISFVNLVRNAVSQSYLKEYVRRIKEAHRTAALSEQYGMIDSFVDQLIQDKEVEKRRSLKSLLLKLIVFTQDYIKNQQGFNFGTADKLFKRENIVPSYTLNSLLFKPGEKGKYDSDFKIGDLVTANKNDKGWECAIVKYDNGEPRMLALVEAAIHYYYHLDNEPVCFKGKKLNVVSFYCKMNDQRNLAAHETRKLDIGIEEIKTMFERIVLPMLEKDYPSQDGK